LLVGRNKELHYSVLVNTPHGRHLLIVSLLEQLNTNYWSNRCGGKLKLFLPEALRNTNQPPPPRGACMLDNIVENDQIMDRDMVRKKFDQIVPPHFDYENFSWFNEVHKDVIEKVAKWIIEADSFGSAYSLLVLTREWLPKRMFVELVNLVILGRGDTGFTLPSIESYMPEDFFDKDTLAVPLARGAIDQTELLPEKNQIRGKVGSGAFGPDDGDYSSYDNVAYGSDNSRYRRSAWDEYELPGSNRWADFGSHDDVGVNESENHLGSGSDENNSRSGRWLMWNQFKARTTTRTSNNRRPTASRRTSSPNTRTASRRISTVTRSTTITSSTPRTRSTTSANPWSAIFSERPSHATVTSRTSSSGTSSMIWSRSGQEESEWYYREDPVANAHHVDWHRINSGHRRGEFFYHMHGQMLARYEAERLSLGLGLTQMFGPEQWDRRVEDEYDPRLGGRWRTRRPGTIETSRMHDMRETVEMLAEFTARYSQGVDQGIDRFGGVFERGLHNTGHVEIGLLSGRGAGVMGSSGGAMRDPIFYRWHAYVQSMFQLYKNTLIERAPYTDTELSFPGVRVESCSVQPDYGELDTFYTYREMASVRLDSLDNPSPGSSMSIQYMRLNHRPFHWNLVIHSDQPERTHAIVRIFMMPTMDGVGNRATIHMDHFYIELTPGTNEIRREELEASHLSKSRWSLNQLQDHLLNGQVNRADFTWGGCGWPRHLNIPRGTEEGMSWTLVVMVSKVLPQDISSLESWKANSNLAWSYCGVREGLVPDSRPMGFPVDRDFRNINTLAMGRDNWHIKQVIIRHGKE